MLAMIIILIVALIIFISLGIYDTGYDEGVRDTEIAYRNRDCNKCANYKTTKCPNTSKCFSTLNKPYFKIKENKDE